MQDILLAKIVKHTFLQHVDAAPDILQPICYIYRLSAQLAGRPTSATLAILRLSICRALCGGLNLKITGQHYACGVPLALLLLIPTRVAFMQTLITLA